MQQRLKYAALLVLLNVGLGYAVMEPVLTACKRSDPNVDKCIAAVVNRIRPNIMSGRYGSDKQHITLDPVMIERMRIDRGPSFSANFTDLSIKGISGFDIKKLRANIGEKRINASVLLPRLEVDGKYSLNMNILVLRLTGTGDLTVNLTDTKAILRLEYFSERVGGKDLVRFRPIDLKLKFDKARFYLKNLFNGDPTLERVGNDAINENPHVLLDEVKQAFEESLSAKFTALTNSLMKDTELQEMFVE